MTPWTKLSKEERISEDIEMKLSEYGIADDCKVVVPATPVSDPDPVVLFVEYDTILTQKVNYIPERVKIEISCRSLIEPFEKVALRSMIEDAPTYEHLIERLNTLQQTFRQLDWK